LAVGEAERAENIIEAPSQRSCGSLDVKTEARVANEKGGLIRRFGKR
jgi:hypothetical protein